MKYKIFPTFYNHLEKIQIFEFCLNPIRTPRMRSRNIHEKKKTTITQTFETRIFQLKM